VVVDQLVDDRGHSLRPPEPRDFLRLGHGQPRALGVVFSLFTTCPSCQVWATRIMRRLMASALGIETRSGGRS
jgi:hypothetical protein